MELELAAGNRGINKQIETVCLFTKPHYATISSTLVRELAMLGEQIDQYVLPEISEKIIKKLSQEGSRKMTVNQVRAFVFIEGDDGGFTITNEKKVSSIYWETLSPGGFVKSGMTSAETIRYKLERETSLKS